MAQPTPPSASGAPPAQAACAPQAVLFACGLNAVRSPMAAALLRRLHGTPLYAASAGVRAGELDPFAVAVMDELGIDIAAHRPITFEELEDLEGLNFDLIITLSPEAHHKALALTHRLAAEVEYWPTADPTDVEGNRAQRLDAYRTVRDQIAARIRARFPSPAVGNE
jgi:protein-tyrosine-phosphatase